MIGWELWGLGVCRFCGFGMFIPICLSFFDFPLAAGFPFKGSHVVDFPTS
jgi:hypothetical protein